MTVLEHAPDNTTNNPIGDSELCSLLAQHADNLTQRGSRAWRTVREFDTVTIHAAADGQTVVTCRRLLRRPNGRSLSRHTPRAHEVRVSLDGLATGARGRAFRASLCDQRTIAVSAGWAAKQATVVPSVDETMRAIHDLCPGMANTLGVRKIDVANESGCAQLTITRRDSTTLTFDIRLDRLRGQLVVAQDKAGQRIDMRIEPDGTPAPARQAVLLTIAGTIGRALGTKADEAQTTVGAADRPPLYTVDGHRKQVLSQAGYQKLATVMQAHELLQMASTHLGRTAQLRRIVTTGIDELRLRRGAPGCEANRRAAANTIPSSALLLRDRGGRRHKWAPWLFTDEDRPLWAQIALATAQAAFVAIPAAIVTNDVGQRARSLAKIVGAALARGPLDMAVLRRYGRQAAERIGTSRLLRRLSVRKEATAHGFGAAIEATVVHSASAMAGVRDLALYAESGLRRLSTGVASGTAEGFTARHQISASDISARAKMVAKRGELANEFARAERDSYLLHLGADTVLSPTALAGLPQSELEQLHTPLKQHSEAHRDARRRLEDAHLDPAQLRTSAAPTDNIDPKKRALIRVGPQAAGLGFGAAISAGLGTAAYGLMGLSPLAQSLAHARFSESARKHVAADDARVERSRLTYRHHLTTAKHDALAARVTSVMKGLPLPVMSDFGAIPRPRGPRPWPYLWRAIKTLPIPTGVAAGSALSATALHPFASGLIAAAAAGAVAAGGYWEADRQLRYRKQVRREPLEDSVAARQSAPHMREEFLTKLSTVGERFHGIAKGAIALNDQRASWKQMVTPFGIQMNEIMEQLRLDGSTMLSQRCLDDLHHLRDTPEAIDAYFATIVSNFGEPARAKHIRKKTKAAKTSTEGAAAIVHALRRRQETEITTIATAELAWKYAAEHLPEHLHLDQLFPDESERTPQNRRFLDLCKAIERLPFARDADGGGTAVAIQAAARSGGVGLHGFHIEQFTELVGTAGVAMRENALRDAERQRRKGSDRPLPRSRRVRAERRFLAALLEPGTAERYITRLARKLNDQEVRRPGERPGSKRSDRPHHHSPGKKLRTVVMVSTSDGALSRR